MKKRFEVLFHEIPINIILRKFITEMNEAFMKTFKRFIRFFYKMHDFILNKFIEFIPVKGMVELLQNMFERVNLRS